MYVYIKSEPFLWTVGHYTPDGKWVPESDHNNKDDAAERVSYLNGDSVKQQSLIKSDGVYEGSGHSIDKDGWSF